MSTNITVVDDFLAEPARAEVDRFLAGPGWLYGWRSDGRDDRAAPFWHKHFAGNTLPDNYGGDQYDCEAELMTAAEPIAKMWLAMAAYSFGDHALVRCYANGYPYGADGTLHTDSIASNSFTSVYFAHAEWQPNWGGELMFFKEARDDLLAVAYPRPNRLVMFPGTIPHVARGVSRCCPVMRVTLMFKTEKTE